MESLNLFELEGGLFRSPKGTGCANACSSHRCEVNILRGLAPNFSTCLTYLACVQTLLISFQRGSPPVESAHRRPNPCSEPRAIPSLGEPSH